MDEVLKNLRAHYFMHCCENTGYITEEMAAQPSDWSPHDPGEDLVLIRTPTIQYVFVVPQKKVLKTRFISSAAELFKLERPDVEKQYPFINVDEELSFDLPEYFAKQWRKESKVSA